MFGLETMPLYLFVDLAEFWLPSYCARGCPQLHPGTKLEFICLGTWQMIKDGDEKSATPASCPERREFQGTSLRQGGQ